MNKSGNVELYLEVLSSYWAAAHEKNTTGELYFYEILCSLQDHVLTEDELLELKECLYSR